MDCLSTSMCDVKHVSVLRVAVSIQERTHGRSERVFAPGPGDDERATVSCARGLGCSFQFRFTLFEAQVHRTRTYNKRSRFFLFIFVVQISSGLVRYHVGPIIRTERTDQICNRPNTTSPNEIILVQPARPSDSTQPRRQIAGNINCRGLSPPLHHLLAAAASSLTMITAAATFFPSTSSFHRPRLRPCPRRLTFVHPARATTGSSLSSSSSWEER
jgi:hypothetical protein